MGHKRLVEVITGNVRAAWSHWTEIHQTGSWSSKSEGKNLGYDSGAWRVGRRVDDVILPFNVLKESWSETSMPWLDSLWIATRGGRRFADQSCKQSGLHPNGGQTRQTWICLSRSPPKTESGPTALGHQRHGGRGRIGESTGRCATRDSFSCVLVDLSLPLCAGQAARRVHELLATTSVLGKCWWRE